VFAIASDAGRERVIRALGRGRPHRGALPVAPIEIATVLMKAGAIVMLGRRLPRMNGFPREVRRKLILHRF